MTRVTRSRTISMLAIATLLTVGVASSASAQNAVVTGRVMSDRGQPLYGANVYITELNISVATNEAGTYTINVPAARVSGQTVALRARAVGFRPESQPLTVSAGTQTLNFDLETDIARLSEVVVTGVTAETQQIKLPFTVARVDTSQMPVTASNPLTQLQGKIPGASIVVRHRQWCCAVRSRSTEPAAVRTRCSSSMASCCRATFRTSTRTISKASRS